MDKVTRLPPGFRFHPTDQELIVQYLKRKSLASPLPASIIPEAHHVCNSDPWDLPGDNIMEQERYFFSTREAKYPNGNRSNRATSSGYWKATGIDKQILTYSIKRVVVAGMKKTLVFYRGKPPHGSRTNWIMHEYRIADGRDQCSSAGGSISNVGQTGSNNNWVLCRIFYKNRGTTPSKNDNAAAVRAVSSCVPDKMRVDPEPVFFVTDLNIAPTCSSTDSSGITNVSTNQSEEEEDTTSSNSICISTQKRKTLK